MVLRLNKPLGPQRQCLCFINYFSTSFHFSFFAHQKRGRQPHFGDWGKGMLSQNDDQVVHKLYVLSTRNKISWNESILTTSTKYLSLGSIKAALLTF